MSDAEIRLEIAKACGWTHCQKCGRFHDPKTNEGADFPDYPNDLNAMHEAEDVLSDEEFALYFDALAKVCIPDLKHARYWHDDIGWMFIDATARQRSEAFLRCKGLWKKEREPISG